MAQRGDEVLAVWGSPNVPRGAKCKCGNPATRKSVAEVPEASPRHLAAEQEGLDCIVHDSGGVAIQRLECDECFNRRTQYNLGQREQDTALRLIKALMEKGATMLESIQSGLNKASSLAKSQATEQDEYGEAGRIVGAMWEQELKRLRQRVGIVDERDEERQERLRNAEGIVNTWIDVTAQGLELIGPGLADRFLGSGRFVERPRSMREGAVNLKRKLAEHVRRLRSIYEQVRVFGVPARAAQSSPTNEEPSKGQPGRRGLELDHDELIYRLAMAQWAEQMKRDDHDMTWNEIQAEIGWTRGGTRKSKVKLLYYARESLHRLEHNDPDNLLEEVAQRRRDLQAEAELKKEKKET